MCPVVFVYGDGELEETWMSMVGKINKQNVVAVTPWKIQWQVDTMD